MHWDRFQKKLFSRQAKETSLPCDQSTDFDSKIQQINLSNTLKNGETLNNCDLKPYGYYNKIKSTYPVSRDIKKLFQKDTNCSDNAKNTNKTSENINTNAKSGCLRLKCAISYVATMRTIIILIATFCCAKVTSSTVFYQLLLRNKRIYLKTRVLPWYVCMNDCNDSYKIVNILQNEKYMEFRASSYAPNVLKTGSYYQTDIRIPNLSRLTIYLTELYRTILIPILLLSNDHIKILPVPKGYGFLLDILIVVC